MDDAFTAGYQYLLREGRLLEQRLFGTLFGDDSPSVVVDVLRGYQNVDGGFGHALEPDTRCPNSLPVYVEVALRTLCTARATVEVPAVGEIVGRAGDYLAGVARRLGTEGAIALATPVIESFPRAAHWSEWTYVPALNPTAGLVGLFNALKVEHPWRASAESWCFEEIDRVGVPEDPHTMSEILCFLEFSPDADRADLLAQGLASHFADVPGLHLDPNAPGYGLSPLHFAPAATARWKNLFTPEQLDGALDHLIASQLPDGGWPISWEPPGLAATLEWRGVVTLEALRTLTSYGRLTPTLVA